MACTCKPKRKSPMTVKVRAYKRKTGSVKRHLRHTPR